MGLISVLALGAAGADDGSVQAGMRTYVYKMISDRGGAPCAPQPNVGERHLLSLALCKPAIRRTAQPGDRLLAVTSRALEQKESYPEAAIIYCAIVSGIADAREYYALESPFRKRPDCVYRFQTKTGEFRHTGKTALHATPESERKDLGRFPHYRNGRVLVCEEFRYFGREAVPIPPSMLRLHRVVASLGQGHRVFDGGEDTEIDRELHRLFLLLARKETRFTPRNVEADVYERRAFDRRVEGSPLPRASGSGQTALS